MGCCPSLTQTGVAAATGRKIDAFLIRSALPSTCNAACRSSPGRWLTCRVAASSAVACPAVRSSRSPSGGCARCSLLRSALSACIGLFPAAVSHPEPALQERAPIFQAASSALAVSLFGMFLAAASVADMPHRRTRSQGAGAARAKAEPPTAAPPQRTGKIKRRCAARGTAADGHVPCRPARRPTAHWPASGGCWQNAFASGRAGPPQRGGHQRGDHAHRGN